MSRVLLAVLFVFIATGMFIAAPSYLNQGGVGLVISTLIFFTFIAIGIGGR
jgi:hypothetical protein